MRVYHLGEMLEGFAAGNGRMPVSWQELAESGHGVLNREEVAFLIDGIDGPVRRISIGDYRLAFGTVPEELRIDHGVVVTSEEGQPLLLLRTLNDNWLVGDTRDACYDYSLRICLAMMQGPRSENARPRAPATTRSPYRRDATTLPSTPATPGSPR
jgi:hypothetical protein